ncbi:MAG: DUF3426 domain-containing protein [Burkholderiales bacterium]|jgi:predicted Zn finger-like uncharacterized protein|nr:DUF3426 domain-containing protein [Burkholderiales bacterium]
MIIHFTRCPLCQTTFRITSQQLALRDGRARCGHCRTVFNAFSALVNFKGERVPGPGMEAVQRETMTLRDSVSEPENAFVAASPPPAPSPPPVPSDAKTQKTAPPLPPSGVESIGFTSPSLRSDIPERRKGPPTKEEIALAIEEVAEERRQRKKAAQKEKSSSLDIVLTPARKPTIWQRLRLPPWCRPLFYLVSLPGLAVLLAAQATYFLHDELASAYPKLTPALSQGCRWLQCEIKPLQNLNALTIEASDLQSDPNDAQQLLLTITLRNRSDKPVAYPDLSLELTDAQDRLLTRRFFSPEMYLVSATDANLGAPPARDLVLRLLLRPDFAASGYRLSLVYS